MDWTSYTVRSTMDWTSYTEGEGGIPLDFCNAAANLLFTLLRASGWEVPEGKHVHILIDLVDDEEEIVPAGEPGGVLETESQQPQ